MKKTQMKRIREKLLSTGTVSRNWGLKRYMSRLSGRISDLRAEGFNITGEYVKTKNGKDFVYKLIGGKK